MISTRDIAMEIEEVICTLLVCGTRRVRAKSLGCSMADGSTRGVMAEMLTLEWVCVVQSPILTSLVLALLDLRALRYYILCAPLFDSEKSVSSFGWPS